MIKKILLAVACIWGITGIGILIMAISTFANRHESVTPSSEQLEQIESNPSNSINVMIEEKIDGAWKVVVPKTEIEHHGKYMGDPHPEEPGTYRDTTYVYDYDGKLIQKWTNEYTQ